MDDAVRADLRFNAHFDLRQYQEAKKLTSHYSTKIELLRERITSLSSAADADRVSSKQGNDKAGIICVLVDMQREYWGRCMASENICLQLEQRINRWTSGLAARVLRDYYLYAAGLEQIAQSEHVSYRHVKRVKAEALEQYGLELSKYNASNIAN